MIYHEHFFHKTSPIRETIESIATFYLFRWEV